MTRVATIVVILLAACGDIPDAATALDARDRLELKRMRRIWLEQGLPDPFAGDCEPDDIEIAHPAAPDDVKHHCGYIDCAVAGEQRPCMDSCMARARPPLWPFAGREPVAVVSARIRRRAWRHEAGHWFERCAQVPITHRGQTGPDEEQRFKRWLDAVEAEGE